MLVTSARTVNDRLKDHDREHAEHRQFRDRDHDQKILELDARLRNGQRRDPPRSGVVRTSGATGSVGSVRSDGGSLPPLRLHRPVTTTRRTP